MRLQSFLMMSPSTENNKNAQCHNLKKVQSTSNLVINLDIRKLSKLEIKHPSYLNGPYEIAFAPLPIDEEVHHTVAVVEHF